MVKIEVENGYYLFKLDDVLKQRNISINKLKKIGQKEHSN